MAVRVQRELESAPPAQHPPGQGLGVITALACASPSGCSAAGIYLDRSGRFRIYAVTERHGAWGKGRAIAVPASLRMGDPSALVLSCASAGNCAAGGSFTAGVERAFVVS